MIGIRMTWLGAGSWLVACIVNRMRPAAWNASLEGLWRRRGPGARQPSTEQPAAATPDSRHRQRQRPGRATARSHFARRTVIAGMLPNTPPNLVYWMRYPQSVVPWQRHAERGPDRRAVPRRRGLSLHAQMKLFGRAIPAFTLVVAGLAGGPRHHRRGRPGGAGLRALRRPGQHAGQPLFAWATHTTMIHATQRQGRGIEAGAASQPRRSRPALPTTTGSASPAMAVPASIARAGPAAWSRRRPICSTRRETGPRRS